MNSRKVTLFFLCFSLLFNNSVLAEMASKENVKDKIVEGLKCLNVWRTTALIRTASNTIARIVKPSVDEQVLSHFMSNNESLPPGQRSFEQGLQFANKNLQYVIHRSNEAVLFHGSKSGSLIAFTSNKTLGGLRSSGELMQSGVAPFTGEQGRGITPKKGINLEMLSTVKITDLDIAVKYSNKQGSIILSPLRRANWNLKNWKEFARDPEWTELAKNKVISAEQQIAQWEHILSEEDQQLISEDFPVLYGIYPHLSREVVTSSTPLGKQGAGIEVGLIGGADFDEITSIFVPEARLRWVKKIIQSHSLSGAIVVSPIEPVYAAFKILYQMVLIFRIFLQNFEQIHTS